MTHPHPDEARSVLVTGASGLVGRQVVESLAAAGVQTLVAFDVREPGVESRVAGVHYAAGDVREPGLEKLIERHAVDTVVHLAAVVTPGPHSSRELEYAVDVLGTRRVVTACVDGGVRQLVYTSSGAAYGYHADNPVPLRESDPLRADEVLAYAWHKRLAEEELARCREEHPELAQLVFRVGTILGERVASPIAALFERRVIVGVAGCESPFVLVWDEDVAAAIAQGIRERRAGIYNLAGDGAIALPEIARRLGKPYVTLPAWLLAWALGLLHAASLAARGAEQVAFLRHRPVLSNEALKRDFGFTPRFTSEECFEHYRRVRFGG